MQRTMCAPTVKFDDGAVYERMVASGLGGRDFTQLLVEDRAHQ
jgi:hypothetical protein